MWKWRQRRCSGQDYGIRLDLDIDPPPVLHYYDKGDRQQHPTGGRAARRQVQPQNLPHVGDFTHAATAFAGLSLSMPTRNLRFLKGAPVAFLGPVHCSMCL